jgi:hypothetical protein
MSTSNNFVFYTLMLRILGDKIEKNEMGRMGEEREVCRVLVVKPEGRRPLGRPRHR